MKKLLLISTMLLIFVTSYAQDILYKNCEYISFGSTPIKSKTTFVFNINDNKDILMIGEDRIPAVFESMSYYEVDEKTENITVIVKDSDGMYLLTIGKSFVKLENNDFSITFLK